MNLEAVLQWLVILPQLIKAGSAAVTDVTKALSTHGIDADLAALEFVITDSARRKAIAEREAQG